MKRWQVLSKLETRNSKLETGDILDLLLRNRNLGTKKEIEDFLHPPPPSALTPRDVGIDKKQFDTAIRRIHDAIRKKESVVVYADYDADGITGGAILWEALYRMGVRVMPYIPHRSEGYGLTKQGIDTVMNVDHP